MEQSVPCSIDNYMIPTITAETYEQSVKIERSCLIKAFGCSRLKDAA